ncbi:hypothetical protein NEHOM01_1483 [Nematocida homosporus]|uniref:uncharacterized protein n=1 Tax=Nematocida homosporus TaxID=1912981 RepID=UPI00221EAD43|nr:uncharacterized protein NEHOM01_1483 [Nematocida homosporus]KAI5186450.1 hypothetical protein NEHOM01_1483 [Nematocida homosporus]
MDRIFVSVGVSTKCLVLGGFKRSEYLEGLTQWILTGKSNRTVKEIKKDTSPTVKKCRLSAYDNPRTITALNRCRIVVLVPNIGLVEELVRRLVLGKSSELTEDMETDQSFWGNPGDDFIIGLGRVEDHFTERSLFGAEVIISTTKALVDLDNNKIDSSQYLIKNEAELEGFERKAKIEMGVYSFLSSAETVFLLEADLMQAQNIKGLTESLQIIQDATPSKRQEMNLKYLSSGEERKQFIMCTNLPTPEVLGLGRQFGHEMQVIMGRSAKPTKSYKYPLKILNGAQKDPIQVAAHYISTLPDSVTRLLVVVKDALAASALKKTLEESALLGLTGIFIADEHVPRNQVKEMIGSPKIRIWITTERFVFYRRKRLHQLLYPFIPTLGLSPYVCHPSTLRLINAHKVPFTLLYNQDEQYLTSALLRKSFDPKVDFEYLDFITANQPNELI